jgi:ribose transport system substrate-binding protein
VEQEGLADCTIVSDNYRAGYAIGEYMMKKQESGRILVLEHETAISGRRRVQGFKDSIAGDKRFEIVNEIGCKGQYEIALPLVEDYIEEGGSFDTVFCLNDLAGEAAVTAVRRHPELGKVYVYGVDGSPDAKSMIGAGEMEATAAQFPTEIGEEAADTLYKMLRGEEYESTITVPIDLVYYSNLEQYDSNRWQ